MGFNYILSEVLSSLLFVFRRWVQLIISPYRAMRAIGKETDLTQVLIIFIGITIYFFSAHSLKEYIHGPLTLLILTFIHYMLTVLFFGLFTLITHKNHRVNLVPFLLLFSYALLPTLLWFVVNSLLFALIPPPRTPSFLGKGFSIVYVSFSVGVLMWKILVMYLAIRFATGFRFFRIVYSLLLYAAIVIPYALFLYSLNIFRIPFL